MSYYDLLSNDIKNKINHYIPYKYNPSDYLIEYKIFLQYWKNQCNSNCWNGLDKNLNYDSHEIPFLNNDTRIHLQNYRPGLIGSYIIGLSFAFGWTPCIGPILGSVLSIAASSETVSTGIILLMIYSAGLGIPFLLAAYGIGGFLKFLSKIRKYIRSIEIFTGLLLILFGFLILTNRIQEIAFFFIKYFPILSQIG